MSALELPNEEFRPIQGYEGLYEISNRGRVKSLPKRVKRIHSNGRDVGDFVKPEATILKNQKHTCGYEFVTFKFHGEKRNLLIHRLVASAFLGLDLSNTELVVNHLDNKRDNNNLTNLEVVTHAQNMWHAMKTAKFDKVKRWIVNQTDHSVYCSASEAAFYTDSTEKEIENALGNGVEVNGYQLVVSDKSIIGG